MPINRVEMFEGRTPEQKKDFVKALAQATFDSLCLKPSSAGLILFDETKSEWATGGRCGR